MRQLVRLLVSAAWITLLAQAASVPPELAKYIMEARKAKIAEAEIRRSALDAGWPADLVNQAIEEAQAPAKNADAQPQPSASKPAAAADTSSQPASAPNQKIAANEPSRNPIPTPAEEQKPSTAAKPADPAATTPPAAETQQPGHGVPDDYEIGAGDVLSVSVWKEPDATVPRVAVRPDGKISMPLIKELAVAGLTPIQAEKLIAQKLSALIVGADVTVVVNEIHSKKIYVTGKVKKEGPIPMNYPMTLMQALSEAGGLTDYAKRKKIYVLRHENGREYRLPFDYDAALRGERMELNVPLRPGDTIVVP